MSNGRPVRAYSAAQLKKMGCGNSDTIRRRYFPERGGMLKEEQFLKRIVENKSTRFIPFRLLTVADQGKVDAFEGKQKQAAKLAEIRKRDREEMEALAELPLDDSESREFLWGEFARKSSCQRDKAVERLKAVMAVQERRHGHGMSERDAVEATAKEYGQHPNTIRNWVKKSMGVNRVDRAAALVSQHCGRVAEAEFTPEAWTFIKKDFLRRVPGSRPPSVNACYRRLEAAAKANGWTIPIKKTVANWIKRKIDPMVVKYRREGMEAVEKCFPAMQRNKEMFDVLEAINGDGYEIDLWADFGNGIVGKPIVWSWQDIRSSKVLSWRMDVSENSELIRLATLDLITDWGIPHYIFIDSTRAATSKQISGGVANRYRFKIKDTDPLGVIPLLGIDLKYTLPGHGRSKPIERIHGIGGYMDFASLPVFVGRGTKGRPIPIAEVEEQFRSFVNEINARPDRQGTAVKGKSFDSVFNELYPEAVITRATEKQRKYCMCVAEVIQVSRSDASITLKAGKAAFGENRHWHEALTAYMGQKVTARFDPANMHGGVYLETLNGEEICFAEATHTGGFKDAVAAKEYARAQGHFKKAVKVAAEAEERLTSAEARAQAPVAPEPGKPQAGKVTQLLAGVNPRHSTALLKAVNDVDCDAYTPEERRLDDAFGKAVALMAEMKKSQQI